MAPIKYITLRKFLRQIISRNNKEIKEQSGKLTISDKHTITRE